MRCAELAEVWYFVQNKSEKPWIWLALDVEMRGL